MAFCANCGTEMAGGAKFCPSCGTPAKGTAARADKEKAGNIVKCPNCGAPVPAMSAVCPECGHEFRNAGVSSGLKEFFNKIMELDSRPRRRVAVDKAHFIRGGIFLVIFIIILCIGFYYVDYATTFDDDIYLIIAGIAGLLFAMIVFAPKAGFTEADNQKRTLIENFPIPNTKEDIIEFLVLASSKIIPAHSLTGSASLQRTWNKIWGIKCRQVYDKADILLAADKDALATVQKVRVKNEKILAAARKRVLAIAAAVVVVIAAIAGCAGYLATGGYITVPEKVTIPSENIQLNNFCSKMLKVNDFTLEYDEKHRTIRESFTFEAIVDADAFIEEAVKKEVDRIRSEQQWPAQDTIISEIDEFHAQYSFPGIDSRWDRRNIPDVRGMKKGEARKVTNLIGFEDADTIVEAKKKAVEIMSLGTVDFSISVTIDVINRTRNDGSKRNDWVPRREVNL